MDIQSPLTHGLYIRPTRPDRRTISYFLKNYSYIVLGIISIIVFTSVYQTLRGITFVFLGGYWLYILSKIWVEKNKKVTQIYFHPIIQFLRSFFLIACVTALLLFLYQKSDYLNNVDNNTLWLLYIPAINVVSERGSRKALFLVLAIVTGLIYWVTPAMGTVLFPFPKPVTMEVFLQCIWLIFLSLSSYILLRYLSDAIADLNLIISIQNKIREMEGGILRSKVDIDEAEYLEKAVEIIQTDLTYEHVNVFRLDKYNQNLICVAAACDKGKELAAKQFKVEVNEESIIGHVAMSGKAYKANDTNHDPHYLPVEAFQDTRAEMVLPIWVRNRLYGVLDIQVNQPNYFLDQDWQAIEILANNIGWVIDNSEQYSHIRWLNGIVDTIADPIFTQARLDGTLRKIAESALQELEADLVLLYTYDPFSKDGVLGPIFAGKPNFPEFLKNPSTTRDNVVWRLIMDGKDEIYTYEDLGQLNLEEHPLFKPSQIHVVTGKPTFIQRENIQSNAMVKLMIKQTCIGVLFMNFRRPRTFTAWDRRRYNSFARLAALAIQKMQLQQHLVQAEKNEISRMFHDMLRTNAVGVHLILDSINLTFDDQKKLSEKIDKAKFGIRNLEASLRYALRLLKENSYEDLQVEVDKIALDFMNIFKVSIQRKWSGNMRLLTVEQNRELYLVIRQALTNAVHHGAAPVIKIDGMVRGKSLQVTVEDNGVGFIMDQVSPGEGLSNMKYRMEEIGGTFHCRSKIGKGTKIILSLPLNKQQEPANVQA